MEVARIDSKTWDCPICHDVMNGDNGGVAISARCYHVFHRVCIETHLNDYKPECPSCRLPNFCRVEVLDNPRFLEQYRLWKSDPEGYVLDENKLRPERLKDLPRREWLTKEELQAYWVEVGEQIKKLRGTDSQEKIDKLTKELDILTDLKCQEIGKENIEQFAMIAEMKDMFETDHLARDFNKKIDNTLKYAEAEIQSLEVDMLKNQELIRHLGEFKVDLLPNREKIRLAAKTNVTDPGSPSPEEARQLLNNVNTEMEAFIESQPEAVKDALKRRAAAALVVLRPNPEPRPPVSTYSKRDMIKAALGIASIFLLYKAARSDSMQFFFKRVWRPVSKKPQGS